MQSAGTYEGFNETEQAKLFEMIGLGALKYFLLKIDPQKKMLYNPAESVSFEGDAAPFIQYTHARICSVLRKGRESTQIEWRGKYTHLHLLERNLIYLLGNYLNVLQLAAERYAPYLVAQYAYELSKTYSSFYAECSILKAESNEAKSFRLALSDLVAQTIREAMAVLGIKVPERM
jgi:arginyl-tRNA synthetase